MTKFLVSYDDVAQTLPPAVVAKLDATYATATALAAKAPLASPAFTGTPTGITKAHVGLSAVDNTSDAAKPVSTAQATADTAAKARANHTGTQLAATVSDFAAAVDARISAAGKTVGVITFGANYEADPTAGGMRLWKVGTTVYLEGSFRNKAVISTVATGQYAAATMPAGFIPLASQWRACAVGQDAVGFGIGTWRVDPGAGTLTWQDSSARTNAPIGSIHIAQSLMSWEV